MITNIFKAIDQHVPAELRGCVHQSLWTPQYGPYHNEGPDLRSHLGLIFAVLTVVRDGMFHLGVPQEVRDHLQHAARKYKELLVPYVLLHDICKQECLTLVYADGRKVAMPLNEWVTIRAEWGCRDSVEFGDRLRTFCVSRGIVQISYYQESDGTVYQHGPMAALWLRDHSNVNPLVVKAIGMHEVAFQFGERGGINIPLFAETFGLPFFDVDPREWTLDELAFCLLVNYADQMGSLGTDGVPHIEDFLWLAKTYLATYQFCELQGRLCQQDRLDLHKVNRMIEAIRVSTSAFQYETVEMALARIVKQCRLPTYDGIKLRQAFDVLVMEAVVTTQIADDVIAQLMRDGKISRETAKLMDDRANGIVRKAIAGCTV